MVARQQGDPLEVGTPDRRGSCRQGSGGPGPTKLAATVVDSLSGDRKAEQRGGEHAGRFHPGRGSDPVGKYGGALSHLRIDDLLGVTMVATCEKVGVPLGRVEDIVAGALWRPVALTPYSR
jgi:hypothetical protein